MRRRFLVTGAGGFVGANLCHALAARGEEVHAVVGPTRETWRLDDDLPITSHFADLCDAAAAEAVVAAAQPHVIYNLAAHGAYPFQTDVDQILNVNLFSLANLLRACERAPLELFVHAGSSSEYGRKKSPMRETDLLEPNTVYGVAKASQSLFCQQWARSHHQNVVVLRLFSVYGPYEEPTRLMPRVMAAIDSGLELSMTSPSACHDFIYIDDVVHAFLAIDALKKARGQVLNVGTGTQSTLADVIASAQQIAHRPLNVTWQTMTPRDWDSDTWVADVSRLRQTLDWTPATTLQRGMTSFLDWFRKHRDLYPSEQLTAP